MVIVYLSAPFIADSREGKCNGRTSLPVQAVGVGTRADGDLFRVVDGTGAVGDTERDFLASREVDVPGVLGVAGLSKVLPDYQSRSSPLTPLHAQTDKR